MAIEIGGRQVGHGHPCYVIAEIGINHNGDVDIAMRLIEAAADAGCDAVKFQKRTVEVVYSPDELAKPRETPYGNTNGDLKHALEFNEEQYDQLFVHADEQGLDMFCSCWDEQAVDFIDQFSPPAYKIASASLTDRNLIRHAATKGVPLLLSTGMSTLPECDAAFASARTSANEIAVMHCVSTYPSNNHDLNLRCINTLAARYLAPIGYSGHELGIATSVAAVAIGARIIERHITLDRSMWGSDQAASLEPHALTRMVRDIRAVEAAMGDGVKSVLPSEVPIMKKLRRVG